MVNVENVDCPDDTVKVETYDFPEPEPLLREIAPGEAYPIQALGPLRPVVEAVQGATLAPIAIPAASALSVVSLAVQGFANVETLAGERPLSLFMLTVAASGQRKSSCDAPLMEALRDFEKEQAATQSEDLTGWQNTHALWKGDREKILAEAKRAKGAKRQEAEADLDAIGGEPMAPPSTDRTVVEPTFEGLTRLYATGQPSLGIFSDEGGQFLGGHAMNRENRQKTLAALNDLWQGNPIRRTRSGDGHVTLFGRRLAIHLMVQPAVAREFMSDPLAADTGFLPRFLMCEPQSTIGFRRHADMRNERAPVEHFAAKMRSTLDRPLPMDADTRELQPRTLTLSAGARALLVQFSDTVETAQAPGGDFHHVTGHASKAAEHAARLAGVLTIWTDIDALEVTASTMADAIALADFYLGEAARLSDAATVSAEIDRAEKLRQWLVTTWDHDEILPSEVLQRAPIRALRESPKARAAIGLLVQHGCLVPIDAETIIRGKPRKEAWSIVRGAA